MAEYNPVKSCETCEHAGHGRVLECRRNPPTILDGDDSTEGAYWGQFPAVLGGEWCSEYKRKGDR